MTTYGHFDDLKREYIITNPKTPVKWINYIGTLAFGGFVDHTGGALICKGDPALNRITKYISQLPASDFKGETLYIRVKRDDGYQVFSPFFVPCLVPYEFYECAIGLGYTRIRSQVFGIETEITVFVPVNEKVEIRDIRITNRSGAPAEIDMIPVVEYTHFDALKQLTNADWVPQTMQSDAYLEKSGLKTLVQYAFMKKATDVNLFTSNLPASSFETDRRNFLGDHEYGTWADPISLWQPELSNYEAKRGDNIGALLHHLGILQNGEIRRLITQLRQETSLEQAAPSIQTYRQPEMVDQAIDHLKIFWNSYLSCQQVETPDPALNSMLNIHNPRQCYITFNWSRYLSLYQLGYGSRGIGMRDSSQDVMGVLASVPDQAKDLLRKLLQVQKRNGSGMHQFNPLTLIASEGDSLEREDRPHYYSDDHLWVIMAVTAYLKETGDFAFLDEVIPYYDKDKNEQPLESGTVLDHLDRAIKFTHQDTGTHGLPLLGFADWNDTMNLPKGAESLFTASLYGYVLSEMIGLASYLQDKNRQQKYQAIYDEMAEKVNALGWDGEWYINYYDEKGSPLGSKQNPAGQIYTYGQAWPVISGFASPERAKQTLDSVFHRLNTRNGIKLSAPGFNGFDPAKGGITTYPPGAKENGGIFLHVNPWVIIAETRIGNGDRAYQYYRQINPAAKNDKIDEFECEPYVYPQNILGDEHPLFGLARNSWLSGTATWAYQAGTRYILGIQPDYHGLKIDPCIPAQWDGFNATRTYRGAFYHLHVKNPQHVCRNVILLKINGKTISGNLIPVQKPGLEVQIEITLG